MLVCRATGTLPRHDARDRGPFTAASTLLEQANAMLRADTGDFQSPYRPQPACAIDAQRTEAMPVVGEVSRFQSKALHGDRDTRIGRP